MNVYDTKANSKAESHHFHKVKTDWFIYDGTHSSFEFKDYY